MKKNHKNISKRKEYGDNGDEKSIKASCMEITIMRMFDHRNGFFDDVEKIEFSVNECKKI